MTSYLIIKTEIVETSIFFFSRGATNSQIAMLPSLFKNQPLKIKELQKIIFSILNGPKLIIITIVSQLNYTTTILDYINLMGSIVTSGC